MIVTIVSRKHGTHNFLIDDEDYCTLGGWSYYLWTSPRHTGFYVMCYSPCDRRRPKRLHRVLMKANPGTLVDHINGDPLDNRRCNLRVTDSSGNNRNARKRRNALTSKYKGVHRRPNGKFNAQIQVDGKKLSLGTFDTQEGAAKAYNLAASLYFKDYAVLNKI